MSTLEARLEAKDASAMLASALALVKAAGYRVTKPKAPKKKDRVGPTFVAQFADGQVTRMSTWTSLEKLDVERGCRLSRMAWESRRRCLPIFRNPMMGALTQCGAAIDVIRERWLTREHVPPAILSAHFEQDGRVLAAYNFG